MRSGALQVLLEQLPGAQWEIAAEGLPQLRIKQLRWLFLRNVALQVLLEQQRRIHPHGGLKHPKRTRKPLFLSKRHIFKHNGLTRRYFAGNGSNERFARHIAAIGSVRTSNRGTIDQITDCESVACTCSFSAKELTQK
ncbi:hypothetical protein SD70_00120 [Gordoniibacillus kamchatkensis]|uniref:Transposase n=1 Tax=Gordoniibacillus kamchatkensis TaxID=1590651 RepID=A0ABR5APC2_9BACL|nr:hypothetical protein SD70_00120 [Paenibacillus sp. VKM B-2647]